MSLTEGSHGSHHSCTAGKGTRIPETRSSTATRSGSMTSSRADLCNPRRRGTVNHLCAVVHVNPFVLVSLYSYGL